MRALHFIWLALGALLGLVGAASCGSVDDVVDAGSLSDAGTDVDGIVDASRDRVSKPTYPVVDGGTDGGQCLAGDYVMQACCIDSYCRGFCVALADGGVGCSCYGIVGGCPEMQECCIGYRGCVAAGSCDPRGN